MRARILTTTLLSGANQTGMGTPVPGYPGMKTFDAAGRTTSGVGSATVQILGRNNPRGAWTLLGTITLSLTASGGVNDAADSFQSNDRYVEHVANVTAISGAGATVDSWMGF